MTANKDYAQIMREYRQDNDDIAGRTPTAYGILIAGCLAFFAALSYFLFWTGGAP